MKHTVLGVLDSRRRAAVDGAGRVLLDHGATVDWWVGGEDRRHHPGREAAVRQRRVGPGPVLETSMRVPSGDAVQRIYAVGGATDLVVMEVENASPVPFAVGFVLRSERRHLVQRRRPDLELPRPALREESNPGEHALVYPVAHRTRIRVAVVLGRRRSAIDLAALPGADDVARGWEAQLRRGMRLDLPDEQLQQVVDAARADALLTRDVATLEDWGFDDEAAAAWSALGSRDRRRARRRSDRPATWSDVDPEQGGAGLLTPLRSLLVHETDDDIALLAALPPAWVGQPLEVHDAPTRAAGLVSYAVRWHGDRPALLWECERRPTTMRAPGLDPAWSTSEARGDALLGRSADA